MRTFLTCLLLILTSLTYSQSFDNSLLSSLSFRNIGPAGMSGRVTSIDVVESDKNIIYVGTSAGGLWVSTDAGISFKPIFDEQKTVSIGDVSIYQKNPNIIYVSTGEGNPRNSQNFGNGVYKTIDGGKSWIHLGLEDTRTIDKIIVHPENENIIWVGAMGSAYNDSKDRGVYKSTDGGQTWIKKLYTNQTTGVADMIIDPSNPNKLIVSMWDFRRWPWSMRSGGPGSAMHLSMDGGESWTKVDARNGLPDETLGRIGLAIAKSSPNVLYANIETKAENTMWKSEDGGLSWKKLSSKGVVGDRPFYYSDVEVDPQNENRVYNLSTVLSISEDGGKTFKAFSYYFDRVHTDHHALWINPDNPRHIIDGNDGGLATSYDMGKHWKFHRNLSVGQFYHINVDNEIPYNVYGGMQDNGCWTGPAYKFALLANIKNEDWINVGIGDGFDIIPDPLNSSLGYSLAQGGNIFHYNKDDRTFQMIMPQNPNGEELRFGWDTPIFIDPMDKKTLYIGSQFVHKSGDHGRSWEIISPDLTTNDPDKQNQDTSGGLTIDHTSAENHTTTTVIEPSSIEKGLIWVGTDDGNIQITQDAGKNWKDVTSSIKGVPAHSFVAQIKHSVHHKGEAFVVYNNFRRGDWNTYVYKTSNYGKSWNPIVGKQDIWGFALSFAQDPIQENLMFLGTEFGLYFTINGGDNWQKWNKSLPTVAVKDMVIHPREHDLVLATFGRSVWILDDISPLRELAKDRSILSKDIHLFSPTHAYLTLLEFPHNIKGPDDEFLAPNRVAGAILNYYSKSASEEDEIQIEILDENDLVVRRISTTAKIGINRIAWDLKEESARVPGQLDIVSKIFTGGANVIQGKYTVRIKKGDYSETKTINVLNNPKINVSEDVILENTKRKKDYNKTADELTDVYNDIENAINSLNKIADIIENDSILKATHSELMETANELKFKVIPKPAKGLYAYNSDLKSQLLSLSFYFFNPYLALDSNSVIALDHIKERLENLEEEVLVFTKRLIEFKGKINEERLLFWE